jgi:hypothetical protein
LRFWLEDKLRPPLPADPWSRDVLSVALLLILASVLIPAWDIARVDLLHTVIGHMASFLLLPALGFLLALRCGAIDLSVWVTSAVAGVVAAVLISRGVAVPVAFAAGAGVGLARGLVNAVGVGLCGLPSLVVTFVTAEAAMWIVGSAVVGRSVGVPELAFHGWLSWHSSPVLAVRVLVVAFVYLSALLGLLMIDYAVWRGVKFPRQVSLFAAMGASGLLAGVGGVLWLLDNSRAPAPTRLIDDLRIPAAAILAGGLFLGRKGRELLAAMSLPAAMLIVTIWRKKTWNLPGLGLALQMLVMTGMTIAVHLAFGQYVAARGTGRRMPTVSVLLTVGGITLVAAAANFHHRFLHEVFHVAGIAVWLSGMPAVIAAMRQEARLEAQSE